MRAAVCIIGCFLPVILSGQRLWNVYDTYEGPVKSVTIIEQTPPDFRAAILDGVYIKDEDPLMEPPTPIDFCTSRHYHFDESSNIVRHILFDKHADTIGFCQWQYDLEGRILDRKEFIGTSRLERQLSYQYPSLFKSIEHSILPSGDTLNTKVIEVDTTQLKKSRYNLHGDRIENMVLTELTDDLKPVCSYYLRGQHWVTISEYSYDSSGSLLMKQTSMPKANSVRCEILVYDEEENLIEEIFHYDSGHERRIVYEYDHLGNIQAEHQHSQVFPTYRLIRYEYEFNQYGDWIRRSIFRATDVNRRYHGETTFREILYY